jgi:hypothetical protein
VIHRTALAFALICLIPPMACSQIVNIERVLAGEPPEGMQGAVQLSIGLRQGNTESRRFEGDSLIRWRSGVTLFQIVLGGAYESAGGSRIADNTLGHIRYGYLFDTGFRLEALFQLQGNSFVRLQRRTLAGAGIRFPLLTRARAPARGAGEDRIDLGLVVMYESEELRGLESEPGWRASLLLSMGWGLSETASVGNQLYYQPLVDRPQDYRILNDFGLSVRVWGPISAKIDARLVYDSRPPAQVKSTDLVLSNALTVVF